MNLTNLIVFACILTIGVYDVGVVFFKGRASNISMSVSKCLENIGFKSPIAVFVAGCIIGHVWFSMKPDCECPTPSDKTQEIGK